jgi:hypothetical protein
MKTTLAFCVLISLFLRIATAADTDRKIKSTTTPAHNVPASQPSGLAGRSSELVAIEQKLLGTWRGPACGGDYTFNPDGTYMLRNFTPGQNTLTGTWSIRWDALPPTLLLTCKTSDFKKKYPTWPEYEYLGKTLELKLLELNSGTLVYRAPDPQGEWRGSRPEK